MPDPIETIIDETEDIDESKKEEENNNKQTNFDEILMEYLKQELSNNNETVKSILLQRLSVDNISHTRLPAPDNITQIGGYYNLLSTVFGEDKSMQKQMLASILGIPYMP